MNKFTDLCDSSALTFVNPLKCWSDKREGPLFRSLKEDKGIKKLEKESIIRKCPSINIFYTENVDGWTFLV